MVLDWDQFSSRGKIQADWSDIVRLCEAMFGSISIWKPLNFYNSMIFPIISIYFLGEPVGNTWQVTEAKAAFQPLHLPKPADCSHWFFTPVQSHSIYGMYDIHDKPWPWSNKSTTVGAMMKFNPSVPGFFRTELVTPMDPYNRSQSYNHYWQPCSSITCIFLTVWHQNRWCTFLYDACFFCFASAPFTSCYTFGPASKVVARPLHPASMCERRLRQVRITVDSSGIVSCFLFAHVCLLHLFLYLVLLVFILYSIILYTNYCFQHWERALVL